MTFDQMIADWFQSATKRPQEVLLNGLDCQVVICKDGHPLIQSSPFQSVEHMIREIQEFSYRQGIRLDLTQPANGGDYLLKVEDGTVTSLRWHAVLPPISREGPLFSIRWTNFSNLGLDDFDIDKNLKIFFDDMMIHRHPMFFSGPTGSGKTSLMSCLLQTYSRQERVIIAENLAEIPKLSKVWVRLCGRGENVEGRGSLSLSDIIRETLRLRPDRLVIGEVRGEEARAVYQALQAFEGGCLTTIHVNDPINLIPRLSDLSQLPIKLWSDLFKQSKPAFILLQNKKPRIRGAFVYQKDGFQPFSSFDPTLTKQSV